MLAPVILVLGQKMSPAEQLASTLRSRKHHYRESLLARHTCCPTLTPAGIGTYTTSSPPRDIVT